MIATDDWGYMYPNGSWNGQMGDIISKRAHIGVTPLFINPLRIKYLDFIQVNLNYR